MEAIYGLNTEHDTEVLLKLADKNNILTSCGSDSHGSEEDDTKHGVLGSQKLEEIMLYRFLDALNKLN